MKKVCIFIFSGTGMTKYVIDKIKLEFDAKQIFVDIKLIENINNISINEYDIVGIAYPVHAFNAPKIVIDFANILPKVNSKSTFIINTAGSNSIMNNSSSELLIRVLCKKGFDVFYNKRFVMPSNFAVKDDEEEVKNKLNIVKLEIPKTVLEIINMNTYKQQSNFISNIMTFIGRIEWIGLFILGKIFYANKNCNRCGVCIINCPNRNIIVNKNHVKFKRNCGLCMRCFYLCSNNCIKIYRLFRFIVFDKWYENMELKIMKLR